ncbi:hypothetical protein M9979_16005 [Sphingomonas sp. RP10(2022)]|uniref:Uncharacterized protein n=1 Tax=Sphingomonas liriopis TaxID=2949094 RepID=A0A9X2HY04_9SPHN|nr:hypothetical protein [Sphingomonas liriopis]MCP3736371.1 hypothetical protein [Sphingomonas liriopis]
MAHIKVFGHRVMTIGALLGLFLIASGLSYLAATSLLAAGMIVTGLR